MSSKTSSTAATPARKEGKRPALLPPRPHSAPAIRRIPAKRPALASRPDSEVGHTPAQESVPASSVQQSSSGSSEVFMERTQDIFAVPRQQSIAALDIPPSPHCSRPSSPDPNSKPLGLDDDDSSPREGRSRWYRHLFPPGRAHSGSTIESPASESKADSKVGRLALEMPKPDFKVGQPASKTDKPGSQLDIQPAAARTCTFLISEAQRVTTPPVAPRSSYFDLPPARLRKDSVHPEEKPSVAWLGSELPGAPQSAPAIIIDIPDHLPSSPLCPSHPKHRGRGRGACPIHGVFPSVKQ